MRRSEIWSIAGGPDYAGKPRPALIVQADLYEELGSVTLCLITSDKLDVGVRVPLEPSIVNGLRRQSEVMIDKISTLPREKLGKQIGRLEPEAMSLVDRGLLVFLGLASR